MTVFRREGPLWRDTTGVLTRRPEEAADLIPAGALVFGSGVRAYGGVFAGAKFRPGDEALEVGRAEEVARLGWQAILAGKAVDPVALLPRYWRATAPEEKLQARTARASQRFAE
jgi:hypothetical protein